jgi:transposase InsO family protein
MSKGLSRIAFARLIEVWDKVYNEVRPHSSLGYKLPALAAWITVDEPLQRLSFA